MKSNLLTAVQGVRSAEFEGVQTVLVTVRRNTAAETRQLLAQVLDGVPCQWVESESAARGVVRGLSGVKDEQTWRIGTQTEVDWIQNDVRVCRTIASSIPPVFDAYATVVIPEDGA